MAKSGAGKLIVENELTAERLTNEIFALLDASDQLRQIAANARKLGRPYAARDIVNLIEEVAGVQGKSEQGSNLGPTQ
jgi:UDP-N-acetylglucosamine--N-acetylmuramyl-(pentapeptide) pyrophosphoryl-undecaprenol N-acetylglucosamine transferase